MKQLALGLSCFRRKLRKARQLSASDWGDFLLAYVDLAFARLVLMFVRPDRLVSHRGFPFLAKSMAYTPESKKARVARIAKAVLLAARYVPWRSDCLVQALAARRRLTIAGLDSELRLGVRKAPGGSFAAHAWLLQGETMVTGGDASEYNRLL